MAVDDLLDELLAIAEKLTDGVDGVTAPIATVQTVANGLCNTLSAKNKTLLVGTTQYDKLLMSLKKVLDQLTEVQNVDVFVPGLDPLVLGGGSTVGFLPTSFSSLLTSETDDDMKQQIAALFLASW